MIVSDIMNTNVITVDPGSSLKEVGRLLFGNRINAVLVVNKEKKLVGLLTDKDIISKFYPSYEEYVYDYIHATNFDLMEEKAQKVLFQKAEGIMKKVVVTVSPETPILKAASIMLIKRVNQLPVVDRGILVGIVTHGDIFKCILKKELTNFRSVGLFDKFASHYDTLIDWPSRKTQELPFLLKILKNNKCHTILDLGCGTGEHALVLANEGYQVTGCDISSEMLTICEKKKSRLDKKFQNHPVFFKAGLGEIQIKINHQFDVIICLGNTLPHTKNLKNDLDDIYHSLTKNGFLIIQSRNYEKTLKEEKRLLNFDFRKQEDKEFVYIRFVDFRSDGLLNFNLATLSKNGNSWKSWGVESIAHYPLTKNILHNVLKTAKFSNIRFYQDLEGHIFTKNAENLVVVAQK